MSSLLKFTLLLLVSTSLLQAFAFEKVATSRATQVHISSQKPLSLGENNFHLEVGHPNYKDSELVVKVFMPAMPGMPYMESRHKATALGDGQFRVNVHFSMRGTWQVHIFVTPREGKKVRVKTSLNL